MAVDYTQTYTTFGGADIVATFNNRVIGELQAITYSVTREKAPIYTLGSADPRSFSRGKRGIAGSLVFVVFDRDALMEELKSSEGFDQWTGYTAAGNINIPYITDPQTGESKYIPAGISAWNVTDGTVGPGNRYEKLVPKYVDQLPPFNITITFANEYGQMAVMRLYGVEILNEGSGMSIDDVVTERACTFVARAIDHIKNAKTQ